MSAIKTISTQSIIDNAKESIASPSALEKSDVQQSAASVTPSFPIEVFPPIIRAIIMAYCKYECYNIDFFSTAVLAVFASAMGNQWKAQFSSTWFASPIIYAVLIGPASCGKTPPLRAATEPLRKYDLELDTTYNAQLKEFNRLIEMSKEQRKSGGFTEIPDKPIHKQMIVINTTIENLFLTLDQNRRGLLMNVDELDGLVANMNRYTNGSDESSWLDFYNGNQLKYSRKSTGEYVNIIHPYVSIIGGTQPGILSSIFGGKRSSNGFASRFLKVYPDIQDMPEWPAEDMPEQFIKDWDAIIRKLLSIPICYTPEGDVDSKILRFSPEAKQKVNDWRNNINRPIYRETDSDYIKGLCGKLDTYIVRLSLVLQIMKWATCGIDDSIIDVDSVEGAVKLVEYFRAMDDRAYKVMNHKPVDGLHEKLFESLDDRFTTADALVVGQKIGTSERTVKRFLRCGVEQKFLKKGSHGNYSKVF